MFENEVAEGNLQDIPFPLLLNNLSKEGFSGVLKVLPDDNHERGLMFSSGNIIFAKTSAPHERLGDLLLENGKITREQLQKSVEVMNATGKRQGRVLVELEYITPEEMWAGILLQLKTIIFNLFNNTRAKYTIIKGEPTLKETILLDEKTPKLIIEGIRRIKDKSIFMHYLKNNGEIFHLNENIYSSIPVEFKPFEKYVFTLVDGKRDMHKILELSEIGEKETLRVLYMGVCFGFLKTEKDFKMPTPQKLQLAETEEFESIIDSFNEIFSYIHRLMVKEVGPVGTKVLEKSFSQIVEYNSKYFPKAKLLEDGTIDKDIVLKSLWYTKFEKRRTVLLKFLNDALISQLLDVRKILGNSAEKKVLKLIKEKKTVV